NRGRRLAGADARLLSTLHPNRSFALAIDDLHRARHHPHLGRPARLRLDDEGGAEDARLGVGGAHAELVAVDTLDLAPDAPAHQLDRAAARRERELSPGEDAHLASAHELEL